MQLKEPDSFDNWSSRKQEYLFDKDQYILLD